MQPMEAALKGAGEIGFTIVSISCSLIAVFIPLLLMGGIVGRLFREFAMTVTHRRGHLGGRIADADADDVLAVPASPDRAMARLYRSIEAMFSGLISGYRRTLDIALRHQFITLLTFFATMTLTVFLYIYIPKGFFPSQDTGVMLGVTEGAQDISFRDMSRLQQKLDDIVAQDPDVEAYGATVGAGIGGQTANNGRIYIALKPWAERTGGSAQDFIDRTRPKTERRAGRRTLSAGRAGHPRGRPADQDRVPVHAAGRQPGRALRLGAEDSGQAAKPAAAPRRDDRPADRPA